LDISSRKILKV